MGKLCCREETQNISLTSVSQIGTFPLAVCAKQMNKPVYAVAESFKFVRAFPLSQRDVPDVYKVSGDEEPNPFEN